MLIELLKEHLGKPVGEVLVMDDPAGQDLIAQGIAKAVPGDPLEGVVNDLVAKATAKLTEGVTSTVDAVIQKSLEHWKPRGAPWVASGPVGQDSAGYSVLKAVSYVCGYLSPDRAKEEIEISKRLHALYGKYGFTPEFGQGSFLIPIATRHLPAFEEDGEKLQKELAQKLNTGQADPDEMRWLIRKGLVTKELGTLSDTAGGALVPPPMLGEIIELQRNLEVFPRAGAREITLPPNGRIAFPKLTGGATAYWVGENSAITESAQSTGNLLLEAKKLGLLVKINNELLRFTSASTEALVRQDMARVGALKADLAMLEGTGGTQIKGLITYSDLTTHAASTLGANGDTFEAEDVALMEGKLPDAVDAPTAWVMRKNFFSVIMNRRADAAVGDDRAGPFLFFPGRRSPAEPLPMELFGTRVVRSAQVSNTRVKGSGTNLTYVLLGFFPDWVIARMGIMELAMNPWAQTAFTNDQTWLRGIQHIDAGPRHAASFCLCDQLIVS